VGYGDAPPITGYERAIAVMIMFLGYWTYSYLIGLFTEQFINATQRTDYL